MHASSSVSTGTARGPPISSFHEDSDGPAAADVTVRCPLAPHNPVRDQSLLPGWRTQQEDDKRRKYGDGCERMGWAFHPFVVDTWGGLAPSARAFMSTLTKRAVGSRLGRDRKGHEMSMWQRLLFPTMAALGRQLSVLLANPLQRNTVFPLSSLAHLDCLSQ